MMRPFTVRPVMMRCFMVRPLWSFVLASAGFLPCSASRAIAQRPTYVASAAPELDSATSAALLREMEHASLRGIPAEPLLAKAREGRLKRAPGARIRQAVAALAVRLDSARSALGAASSADELVAGADALAAGAAPYALRAVRTANPHGVVSVALGALAQLVASGIPGRRATAMVVDLLRRNVAPARVIAFGNAVESDVASGIPAEEAAIFRLRAASAGGTAGAAPGVSDLNSNPPPPPPPSSPRRRP